MIVARALKVPSYRWVCVAAALFSSACVIEVNTEPRLAPPTEEEIWEQHFNDIVDDFNAGAQPFAEDVGAMGGAGARFFWVGAGPKLHSYDVLSTSRVDYELPLAQDVYPDLAFGADAVVTATRSSGTWQISAYAAAEPSALIDTITWAAEEDGSDIWSNTPISIDGALVYLLDPENVIHRWRPGMGAPEPLFSLADRGLMLGQVPRFSVHGDDVLVLDEAATGSNFGEGGVLWHVRLSEGAAEQVATSASEVCFNAGTAVYRVWNDEYAEPTIFRFSSSDGRTEDLTALLLEARVEVEGLAIDPERLRYNSLVECQPGGITLTSELGVFFFDPDKGEAEALLLQKSFDGDTDTSTTYSSGVVIVEHVAFLQMTTCTFGGSASGCEPPAVSMRDLSAH
jgi:hypothetical protein